MNEESSDTFIFEFVTIQKEFLVKEEDEIQSEELICEATVENVESCNFKTKNLCKNVGIVSDDEVLKECQKEIALLEYLLENSEYDREIAEGRVHYSEQEQRNSLKADGIEERLADSLENLLENSLGRMNQHTEMVAGERGALRPYGFLF